MFTQAMRVLYGLSELLYHPSSKRVKGFCDFFLNPALFLLSTCSPRHSLPDVFETGIGERGLTTASCFFETIPRVDCRAIGHQSVSMRRREVPMAIPALAVVPASLAASSAGPKDPVDT